MVDGELLRVVYDDLRVLTRDWNQDIDDASLRISSPILYRLLVENALGRAAAHTGVTPRVLTPAVCKSPPLGQPDVVYWQAGGAKHKGAEIAAAQFRNRALSDEEVKANYESTKHLLGKQYPVKLATFTNQTVFLLHGVQISRGEVIKFVNNKLGGRHYDTARGESPLERKYSLLDSVGREIKLADKNAVYFELLSAGQHLVKSRDIEKLLKELCRRCGV